MASRKLSFNIRGNNS